MPKVGPAAYDCSAGWLRAPLVRVAPARPALRQFAPEDEVWQLSLDQIESHTGMVKEKVRRPAGDAGSSTFVFDDNNVLYSKLRPYLNKVVCPDEAGVATTELVALRPCPLILDRRFLAHYLRSPEFLAFAQQCVAGVKMPRVMMDKLWAHLVPLPPLSEQRRIVEILDQADALRQLRAAADAKAERILPALFCKMFGDPATNPMGWPISKLGDRDITLEFRYGTSTKCEPEPQGFPILRIPNVLKGEIDLADLKYADLSGAEVERLLLERGDLLFVRTNGNREYVGRCAVFDLPEPFLFASYLIRARLNPPKVDPWYVAAFLRSPAGRQHMSPVIRTTAGQSNISVEGLSSIEILLPPIEHQHRFRSLIQELLGLRRQRESAAAALQSAFDTLVHRAFSGDLTVKWREAHMQELLAEMEQQMRYLDGAGSDAGAASARLGSP